MTAPSAPILSPEALQDLAIRVLIAAGLNAEDAKATAEILVLAELFGINTHGLDRLPSYCERVALQGVAATPRIEITRLAPALLSIDGGNGLGPLVAHRALAAVMEAAAETGVAAGFVRGSNHFGPAIPYCQIAAEAGFASIVASNATLTIAPTGGKEARLGNNPLGIGVPHPEGDHVVLDMAMSVVARAKVRRALKLGQSIPDTWATDKDGLPTTDPAAALDGFLLPFGGYKGYGLSLMVDLLAGALSGAAFLTRVKSWVDAPDEPQNLGHFILCIDTKRLGGSAGIGGAVRDFVAIIKETPPVDPAKPVLMPGELERAAFNRNRQSGLALPVDLYRKLLEMAGESAA